jgi:hypothetical protein
VRRLYATAWGVVSSALLLNCRDGASSVIPSSPLGRYASAWLLANNRGNAHALAHFILGSRGSLRMSAFQQDSALGEALGFAKRQGRLVAIRLLYTSDTSLAVLLHSDSTGTLRAVFRPAPQPNVAQVIVEVSRAQGTTRVSP